MRIKFVSDYDNSSNLLNRFIANYSVPDSQLAFTTSDDYDYLVAFNRSDEPLREGAKLITVVQEPSFSEAFYNNRNLLQSDHLLIHDPQLFEVAWGLSLGREVESTPAFMFYHDRVPITFFNNASKQKKIKKVSIVMSSQHFYWGNYLKRIMLLDQILKSDLDIDIYGRGWNIPDGRFLGEIEHKYDALLPYEYSIALENSNEFNYISEKFVDCVLCNTVPIYNGAPNVGDVYNKSEFRLIDINSHTIVDDIKRIIKEPAPGTKENMTIYKDKMNLYSKLKEIIFKAF